MTERGELSSAVQVLTNLMSQLQNSLSQNVQEIKDDVGEVKGKVIQLASEVTTVRDDVREMTDSFRGRGGQNGMETRLVILERQVDHLRDTLSAASARRWQLWLALITAGLALAVQLLRWMIEHKA